MRRPVTHILSEPDRARFGSARCLVVDANEGTRRLLCELLRSAGISDICTVAGSSEAFEALRQYDPDIALLDWDLPGCSGVELARTIRQAARKPDERVLNPRVALIMLTQRHRERDVIEARNAGIDEFVLRPYSMSALTRAISATLFRRRTFVVSETYVGPDRRRRKLHYEGALRRDVDVEAVAQAVVQDHARQEISIELLSVKTLMQARQGLHRPTMEHMVRQLISAGRKAHEARLELIAQATRSLKTYCEVFGERVDTEVIDMHLGALIALSELTPERLSQYQGEGERIISDLDRLVKKRHGEKVRSSRRLTPVDAYQT